MRHIKHCILWLLIILTASCVGDDKPNLPSLEGESLDVTAYLHTNTLSRADFSPEYKIATVDVLAFQVIGNIEFFAYRVKVAKDDINDVPGEPYTKQIKLSLLKNEYKYRFIFLANATKNIDDLGEIFGDSKQNVFSRLVSSKSIKWNISEDNDIIPMWGETPIMQITDATFFDTPLPLLRMLARVDITMESKAANVFKLKSVHVYNPNIKGLIIPAEDKWNSSDERVIAPSLPGDVQASSTPLVYDNLDSETELLHTIYLYETQKVIKTDASRATCLVIGGLYNGAENYYRVDFEGRLENDDDDDGGPPGSGGGGGGMVGSKEYFKPVLRNHIYKMNIVEVSKEGYQTAQSAFEASITRNLTSDEVPATITYYVTEE